MTVACNGWRRWFAGWPLVSGLRPRPRPSKEERLRAAGIFRLLSGRRLRAFAALVDEIHVTAGQELARVGGHRRFIYLVLTGRVVSSLEHPGAAGERRIVLTAASDANVLVMDERFLGLALARVPALRPLLSDPDAVVVHLDHDVVDEPAGVAS